MITVLESEKPVTTKVRFKCSCRTYEDYNYEKCDLKFEMATKNDDLIKYIDSEFYSDQMDPKQQIEFVECYIDEAYFEEQTDYTTGRLEVIATIKSEKPISDSDMDYLAESILSECAIDELSCQVEGTVWTWEMVGWFDRDIEKEVTFEINESSSISYVVNDVSWETLK